MPEPRLVSDSGPLIALAGLGQLKLLSFQYERVAIPRAVFNEVTEIGAGRRGALDVAQAPWIETQELLETPELLLIHELGRGEAEAIALACRLRTPVLIDERRGRRVAETVFGLRVRGTVGVLAAAKRSGEIPHLRPLLERLRQLGYFLSNAIIEQACRVVGE